jgi:hypothetical protein
MRHGSRSVGIVAETVRRGEKPLARATPGTAGSPDPDRPRDAKRRATSRTRLAPSLPGRISFCLLGGVLVLAPFPFGSTEPLWLGTWAILLAVSLALTDLSRVDIRHLAAALPAFLLWVAYAGLSWFQVRAGDGRAHPIWADASRLLGEELDGVIAVSHSAWPSALGPSLVFVMCFVGALLQSTDRDRASLLLKIVALAGIAYALFGVVSLVAAPRSLLWRDRFQHVGSLTGTFVSRNTAATFFGACAVLWFARAFEQVDRLVPGSGLTGRDLAALFSERPPGGLIPSALGGFVCLATAFMTTSRAGTALTLSAIALTALLSLRRRLSGTRVWAIAALCLACVLLVLFQLWGGGIAARLQRMDSEAARFAAYRSTLDLIVVNPWLGTGLGTFEDVFPRFRLPEVGVWFLWDRAHNTLLELAAEMGVPFAASCVAVWIGYGVLLLRGCLRRRRDAVFATAGLAVGLLGGLHTLLEFSLQIPGFAAPFAAVVGMGIGQSFGSGRSSRAAAQLLER